MNIILILILITVVFMLCVICGAVGFFLCDRLERKAKPKTLHSEESLSDFEKEKAIREMNNMLRYDGSEQE